jgi:dihydrofolate reductase
MNKVTAGFSMSLDGFVADAHDDPAQVFKWYSAGGTDHKVKAGHETFHMSAEGADYVKQAGQAAGVLVTGRRTFDLSKAWGGKHPMNVPVVVVTHNIPAEWADKKDSIFTFVTDGVESAIAKAQEIAGEKEVVVGAPSIAQQCVGLGILDEISIALAPVLLCEGVRLFDKLGADPRELQIVSASGDPNVTHIIYRIIRK